MFCIKKCLCGLKNNFSGRDIAFSGPEMRFPVEKFDCWPKENVFPASKKPFWLEILLLVSIHKVCLRYIKVVGR